MGSVNKRLHLWLLQRYRKGYLIILVMQKPQNGLILKRKAPSWCKNVRKQMFFGFRYLIIARKIYHALIVVYLIFYPKSYHERYKCGRPQMACFAVWDTCYCLWEFLH